jgi:thiamine biosynthesis lipoprotein ApbE
MKRIPQYLLGFVAVFVLAGCASHHHDGMHGEGKSDAYWQMGQEDMASLIDRTVKDQEKARQVKSAVNDIVAELKASREQERAGHRRLYELNANYAATPEEFNKVLDEANNRRMQSAAKILSLRFKMKDLMTAEEWKVLSDQMLAHGGGYRHSGARKAKTGY